MARRSSARLRNRNSSTPKRVSLSHDAPTRTPRTAPSKLTALQESDEMPGAFPRSASPPSLLTTSLVKQDGVIVPVKFDDTTPKNATPIKPTEEEMHPKQHQQSTAKPLDEARWLGFSNMAPHTEPAKYPSKIATLQGTPTRAPKARDTTGSPRYAFTFRREQSLELSPEAKKLMSEKREEAARIREQMVATGEGPDDSTKTLERKIATPKGKKSRFSAVHMEQFQKMDSIASHASAFRADRSKTNNLHTFNQPPEIAQKSQSQINTTSKSLKRKQSIAQLDEHDQLPRDANQRSTSKTPREQPASHLPRSTSTKSLSTELQQNPTSPHKRPKRIGVNDVSPTGPSTVEPKTIQASAAQSIKTSSVQAVHAGLSTIASPTQASLVRVSSIKAVDNSKIPAPAMRLTPKASGHNPEDNLAKPVTPFLACSPSKGRLFANLDIDKPNAMMSPILKRSPLKGSTPRNTECEENEEPKIANAPLLARSPLKMSVTKSVMPEADYHRSATPLLAQSPAKITLPKDVLDGQPVQTPTKPSNSLMGRFNLLRSSPMKSILRSPQRLYSDDPAKVAAGTHLATPPKFWSGLPKVLPGVSAPTAPSQKHVDFSSSTKARYERAQSELSSTPSKESSPLLEPNAQCKSSPNPDLAEYPTLPSDDIRPVLTPQKRRQTTAAGDFTFRVDEHNIKFGQSPKAPSSVKSSNRASTIRHVSAEPKLPLAPSPFSAPGSKKRKFDFENDKAVDAEKGAGLSDKENEMEAESERPAKRAKPSAPEPAPAKPTTRHPTLGVKPTKTGKDGKEKKPSTISMARLNALAQPKRRV